MLRRSTSTLNILLFVLFATLCTFGRGSTDNTTSLWDDLYSKCGRRGSFYCVQDNLMNYINTTLDSDIRVTDGVYFVKSADDNHPRQFNALIESGATRQGRSEPTVDDEDDESTQSSAQEEKEFEDFVRTVESLEDPLDTNSTTREESGSEGFVVRSLNRVSDILYEKTTNYLSSHDLRLDLPSFVFGKSRMVVSPRGLDHDGGIMLKLNFVPLESGRNGVTKYFHKLFRKKLLTSFLALLLIIKLVKIKLLYVLPVIIGVHAAKKLLLKTLLFLFPPLVHLLKLCTYYHAHASKLHFHHLKIKHHHHHIPVPVPVPQFPAPLHKPHYDAHDDLVDGYLDQNLLDHDQAAPYEPLLLGDGAPEAAPDYYTRNDETINQHANELASWGLKDFHTSTESAGVLSGHAQDYSPYAESNYDAAHAASVGSQTYVSQPKKNKVSTGTPWKTKSGNDGHGGLKSTLLTPFDSYYTRIMQKIDGIFLGLGFNDEGCRERLICSIYKDPNRFSPHSNLLSTELSRDPGELERPSQSNLAAVRFYRYLEAARDGQSQKDCLDLYRDCAVNTE